VSALTESGSDTENRNTTDKRPVEIRADSAPVEARRPLVAERGWGALANMKSSHSITEM